MKKIFMSMLLIVTVLLITIIQAYAAIPGYKSPAKPVKVFVEGEEKALTLPILEGNGRTLYPFRELMGLLGAEVGYNSAAKQITAAKDGVAVAFTVGKTDYTVNGEPKKMDTPVLADMAVNSTYIPIRYAAEALGYTVDWLVCGDSNEIWLSKEYKVGNINLKVMIDNKLIEFPEDITQFCYDGPLYVPLDYTIKQMGGKTSYDSKTQLITVQKGSTMFKVKVGSVNTIKGAKTYRDDDELISKNGVVYISIGDLAFGFDKSYDFDTDTDTFIVEDRKTEYVKVYLDDKEITFPDSIRPYVAYDETQMPVLLPVEYITAYLGGEAKWDSKNNSVKITYKEHTIIQKDDKKAHAYVDGKEFSTSNRLIVKDGVAYMGALDYSTLVFQRTGQKDFEAIRDSRDHHVTICTKEYYQKVYGDLYGGW